MRSCIYCGRELADGEVCNCPQSAAYRQRRNAAKGTDNKNEHTHTESKRHNTQTSYKTGYAEKDSYFKRKRDRRRAKRAARASAAASMGDNAKKEIGGFWSTVRDFMRSPVDGITNPGNLSIWGMMIIAAVLGAFLSLCVFFLKNGSVGPFKLLASLMSINGTVGYKLIGTICLVLLCGAAGGMIIFFIYSGIFHFINRFIMKMNTTYREFSVRIALALIPFAAVSVIAAVLSFLSPIVMIAALLCGAVCTLILTYEGLKTEWLTRTPSSVIYAMLLGYFIFLIIMTHLLIIGFALK